MQWWDGGAWRDEFAEPQGADLARFENREKQTAAAIVPEEPQHPQDTKINVFNSMKIAKTLQKENQRLSKLIDDHGLLEVAEIDALRVALKEQIQTTETSLHNLSVEISARKNELSVANSMILDVRTAHELQEVGLFDFEHPAENSVSLGTELAAVRSAIKSMVQQRTAITATTNFTFNNSASKGKKFVKDISNIMLRAYNAESENAIKTVRAGNLGVAQERLSKVKDQIARQGTMVDLRVAENFHSLRLKELELASRHLQALQAEKEADRERRAELAEQRKA